MAKSPKESKARNFTFLIYPESAPSDWVQKLEAIGQPMAISPLHDKDKVETNAENTQDIFAGREFKKEHYHCVYVAKNSVTASSVRKRVQRALGNQAVAMVQIVDNIQGVYQYLTHESKDAIAKKKHVYDKKDIQHLNNFDIDRYTVLDKEDKEDLLKQIRTMIVEQRLCHLIDMETFVNEHGQQYGISNDRAYQTVLKENFGLLRLYFDGNYQKMQRQH